jgi:hypothetical protein
MCKLPVSIRSTELNFSNRTTGTLGGELFRHLPPSPGILKKKSNSKSKKIYIILIAKELKILSLISDYTKGSD